MARVRKLDRNVAIGGAGTLGYLLPVGLSVGKRGSVCVIGLPLTAIEAVAVSGPLEKLLRYADALAAAGAAAVPPTAAAPLPAPVPAVRCERRGEPPAASPWM